MELRTLEEIRAFFEKDRFATENGAVIDAVGEHYAKCSMKLTKRHLNGMGAVMGGVHYTLADFAFAVATNCPHPGVVSLNASITYLKAIRGTTLIAEAKCIKEGKSTNCYQVDIYDELETHVATVMMTGYRTQSSLI